MMSYYINYIKKIAVFVFLMTNKMNLEQSDPLQDPLPLAVANNFLLPATVNPLSIHSLPGHIMNNLWKKITW